jgi:hypothetical protein
LESTDRPQWTRGLAELAWLAGWALLLWLVARPWRDLGGLVAERLRWLHDVALWGGVVLGHTLGVLVRPLDPPHAALGLRARALLYPAAILAASALIALRGTSRADAIGVVLTAWLSYTAGASTALLGVGRGPARPDPSGSNP